MPYRSQAQVLQKKAVQHVASPAASRLSPTPADPLRDLLALQHVVGNQAVTLALQQQAESRENSVPPVVRSVLSAAGQPLDAATRATMEARFGHDFSQVRLHTDGQAAASAHTVSAQAYTIGQDIVFGGGRYAPETDEGKRLLAHELTHVVQQSCGAGFAPSPMSEARMEREAQQVSLSVLRGQQTVSVAQRSGVGVARQAASDDQLQDDLTRYMQIKTPALPLLFGPAHVGPYLRDQAAGIKNPLLRSSAQVGSRANLAGAAVTQWLAAVSAGTYGALSGLAYTGALAELAAPAIAAGYLHTGAYLGATFPRLTALVTLLAAGFAGVSGPAAPAEEALGTAANTFEAPGGGPGAARIVKGGADWFTKTVAELLEGKGLSQLKTIKLPKGTGYSVDSLFESTPAELEEILTDPNSSKALIRAVGKILKIVKEPDRLTGKGGDF